MLALAAVIPLYHYKACISVRSKMLIVLLMLNKYGSTLLIRGKNPSNYCILALKAASCEKCCIGALHTNIQGKFVAARF
jgi:hypothetical protein